jgi:hypothetical protein
MIQDDLPLFPREPHQVTRRTDPETSFAAGASVIPNLKEIQQIVFDVLRRHPDGLADPELDVECCKIKPRPYSTYRKRRGELVAAGLVFKTSERRKINGSSHSVWALTLKALFSLKDPK